MKNLKILLLFILITLTACNSAKREQVVVFNISEYMDTSLFKDFERQTGIDVIYENFTSQEEMFVKLSQSSNNYDVIVPTDYMVDLLIKKDMLQKLDFDNIPNYKYIEDRYKHLSFDPHDEYTLPYFTSSFGIVYNSDMVDEPITKRADLWNPKYKGEIVMYDLARISMAAALQKLGYSLNSTDMDEINAAKKALIEQKPLVFAYLTDEARDVIVQKDAIMAIMYSGDALKMRLENPDIRYVIPSEGGNLQIDNFAIPKRASNKKNAELFINYMTDPKVSAKNAEYMGGFTSPVKGVRELLPKEIADSYEAYPDEDEIPSPEIFRDIGDYMEVYADSRVEVLASY